MLCKFTLPWVTEVGPEIAPGVAGAIDTVICTSSRALSTPFNV